MPIAGSTDPSTLTAKSEKGGIVKTKYVQRGRTIVALVLLIAANAILPTIAYAAPPAQVPDIAIFDAIIDAIDTYKTPIAILGIMVIGLGLLAKPLAPEWAAQNRGAVTSMIFGGILIFGAAEFAPMILGT